MKEEKKGVNQMLLRGKRYILLFLGMLLLALPAWSTIQAAKPSKQQTSSTTCLFFTETGNGKGGFAVSDEDNVYFASAFSQWGLTKIGYPISQRLLHDGFVTQAFQKGIMQWHSDTNSVALVNILDDLHNAGFDERLLATYQTPMPLPAGWDGNLTFEEVVQKRQALLDKRPALRAAYFSAQEPLVFYGLPTSEVNDMGNHYAIRLQRAVLQEWKEDVPWAKAGQVTIANGGDIAKDLGFLPAEALTPLASSPCQAGSSPSTTPPSSNDEAEAKVCTADMALVEISHTLGEEVELLLQGPEVSAAFISRNETERHCMTPGNYTYRSFARISGQERGSVTFNKGCQCLRLYWPINQPACTCSNNPANYTPLPKGIIVTQ